MGDASKNCCREKEEESERERDEKRKGRDEGTQLCLFGAWDRKVDLSDP